MTPYFTDAELNALMDAVRLRDAALLNAIGEAQVRHNPNDADMLRTARANLSNAISKAQSKQLDVINKLPGPPPLYDIRWRSADDSGCLVVSDPAEALKVALAWAEKPDVTSVRVLVYGTFIAAYDPVGYAKQIAKDKALAKLTDEDKVALGLVVEKASS